MKEGMEKIDPEFENEKEIAALEEREKIDKFEKKKQAFELKTRAKKEKFLEEKFSEILEQHPIVMYKKGKKEIFSKSDKAKEVLLNHDDQGISVSFNNDNWIRVYTKDIMVSYFFDEERGDYKITKDSFDTILTVMHDAIGATSCSESDKENMFQMIIDNFKSKIIEDEDIEKID